MQKLCAALAALCAMIVMAPDSRADGSLKDSAAPIAAAGRCVGGTFSGAYVGGHIGVGGADSSQQGQDPAGNPVDKISESDTGFTIGTHGGYNVQCGRVVFGFESEFNYIDADNKFACPGGCGVGSQSVKTEFDWFGGLRGRLGFVHNENLLIYATGGLAYARLEHSFSDPAAGPPPGIAFSQSDKDTNWGYMVGGGIEWMRDARWSLRAEALYVDLGSDRENYSFSLAGCPGGTCSTSIKYDDSFWVARLGLTYHFGAREERIAPLK